MITNQINRRGDSRRPAVRLVYFHNSGKPVPALPAVTELWCPQLAHGSSPHAPAKFSAPPTSQTPKTTWPPQPDQIFPAGASAEKRASNSARLLGKSATEGHSTYWERKRRREPQQPFRKRKQISASGTEPGRPRCGEEERQLLSGGVPTFAASLGLSVRHLGNRSSALPRSLEDLA